MESLPSLLLLRKVSLFVEELLNGTRELRIKRHFALMEALDRLAITSDQELQKRVKGARELKSWTGGPYESSREHRFPLQGPNGAFLLQPLKVK